MTAAAVPEDFGQSMTALQRHRPDIRDEIRNAIANAEFELHFQPIASIATGEIETVEALVRWRHPQQGLLPPALFLPFIEQSDTAWLFTLHVIEMAATHARALIDAGQPTQVAVNIPAPLVSARLAAAVPELLAELGLPPRMLVFEITESAVMEDPVGATRALEQLTALGIGGIAIDDFGTGHSSLGRLRDLPIDSLKLDRSFIAELDRGTDPAFVRAVIELGHYLGLRVIAEGVEDEHAWRTLAQLGADGAQGYWLSRPLPGDEVCDWLARHDIGALARCGAVGERRHGVGRRTLDRIAGAFERAPDAMLVSDHSHRWVAVNGAARALLNVRASSLLARHVDDTASDDGGNELSLLVGALSNQPHLTGICAVTTADGSRRRVRYELRRSMVPGHHVWVLAPAPAP